MSFFTVSRNPVTVCFVNVKPMLLAVMNQGFFRRESVEFKSVCYVFHMQHPQKNTSVLMEGYSSLFLLKEHVSRMNNF